MLGLKKFHTTILSPGNTPVNCMLEYFFHPKENRTPTYPGCRAEVEVMSVQIGGALVNPEVFSSVQLIIWEDQIATYEELSNER